METKREGHPQAGFSLEAKPPSSSGHLATKASTGRCLDERHDSAGRSQTEVNAAAGKVAAAGEDELATL